MNLRQLQQLSTSHHLDVYYADESTFSMNPCLPYGWQAKGETVRIFPQSNRKINVFGIFRADNRCWASFSARNIKGETVVTAIDEFCQQLTPGKPSILM